MDVALPPRTAATPTCYAALPCPACPPVLPLTAAKYWPPLEKQQSRAALMGSSLITRRSSARGRGEEGKWGRQVRQNVRKGQPPASHMCAACMVLAGKLPSAQAGGMHAHPRLCPALQPRPPDSTVIRRSLSANPASSR